MRLRPYISLDIETTGLDRERSQVLEIGAVFDDFLSPLAELKTFNAKIHYPHLTYGEFTALSMNKQLIYELSNPTKFANVMGFHDAIAEFIVWIKNCRDVLIKYEETQTRKYEDHKIIIAGKNVSAFDMPIIKNQIVKQTSNKDTAESFVDEIEEITHFRFIDVGSMYLTDFNGYIPSLSDINKLTGREKVSHRALDDAFDVVCAIRHKFGISFKV